MSEMITQKGAFVVAQEWGVAVTFNGPEREVLSNTQAIASLAHPILEAASGQFELLTQANAELAHVAQEQAAITELIKLFGVPEDLLVRPAFMELAKHEIRIRRELAVAARHAQDLAARVQEAMRIELNRAVMQELQSVRQEITQHRLKQTESQKQAADNPLLSGLNQQNNADFEQKLAKLRADEILLQALAVELARSMMTISQSRLVLSEAAGQTVAPVTAQGLMLAN